MGLLRDLLNLRRAKFAPFVALTGDYQANGNLRDSDIVGSIANVIASNVGKLQPQIIRRTDDGLNVRNDYLSRIFKRETGQNLNQYIRMYRMEKAKELLRSTRRKVSEIGHAVGYLNDSYFIHNFSDYTGVTPEKYRDQKGIG